MNKLFSKIKYLFIICICFGMIVPTYAITIEQTAPANIIRPYTFGFGNQGDSDEGVSELVKAGDFKHLMFTDSTGYSIPYWVHIPTDGEGNPIENLPLVMYMHGYSDGGNNEISIRYHNAVVFRLIQKQDNPDRQAIILIPQTPNATNGENETDYFKDQWVGIKGNDKWSQWNIEQWDMDEIPRTNNLNAVVELVKTIQQQTKSDVNCAYVTGISMGGCATWDLISRDNEDIFAAAVPICGIGDPDKAKNAQNIPIKMYHGLKDTTINHMSSLKMYSSLRKYGNVSLVEYDQEGHPCWNAAYSPILDDDNNGISNIDDLISWMFNQSKNGTLDGKVDKNPLISILYDAKQEKKENYLLTKWNELQEAIKQAEILLNSECDDNEVKEIIKKLDEIMTSKKASYVGSWNLDEGKGNTITDTEGKYTGTLQGEVSWIDGVKGKALDFNGNGYVDLNIDDLEGNWSAGMWVKRSENNATNTALLSGDQGEIKLEQWENTTKVGITEFGVEDYTFNYTAPIDEWVQLTFVSDESGTTLYVNGEYQDHLDVTIKGPVKRIGANAKSGLADSGSLYGSLDEINIYNRALTADEVKELAKLPEVDSDKTALKIAVDLANAITDEDLEKVIPAVADEFIAARDEANAVYNDASATQVEVNNAFDRLAKVMHMLDFVKGDKTALKAFIDKVSGLEADKYTEATWTAFETKLNEANAVYNDENAMQEEVNSAHKELVTAFLNLRLIPDKSLLEELINQANGLNAANYTKATYKVLSDALNEAKVVFENPNATQKEVDNAKAALEKAIAGLQANSSTSSNVDNTVKTPVSNGDTTTSVKTGDESLVGMFATIALLSVAGYTVLRRKEN